MPPISIPPLWEPEPTAQALLGDEERQALLCQVLTKIEENDRTYEAAKKPKLILFWEDGEQVQRIRSQRLFELTDHKVDEKAFLDRHFARLSVDRCYRAARVYQGIPYDWLHEVGKRPVIETCILLTTGQPMMAKWIRRLLFDELVKGRSCEEMKDLIEEIRGFLESQHKAGGPLDQTQVAEHIATLAQDLAALSEKRRLFRKIEDLGRQMRDVADRTKDGQRDPELLQLFERELGEPLDQLRKGQTDLEQGSGAGTDQGNGSGTNQSADSETHTEALPKNDKRKLAREIDTPPEPEPGDPEPGPKAPRPKRFAPEQLDLAVPYPQLGDNPCALERALSILALGCLYLTRYNDLLVEVWKLHRYTISNQLALRLQEKARKAYHLLEAIRQRIEPNATEGLALLFEKTPLTKGETVFKTYEEAERYLPLNYNQTIATEHPMAWFSADISDPFEESTPSKVEERVWPVLGILNTLIKAAQDVLALPQEDADLVLLYQTHFHINEASLAAMCIDNTCGVHLRPVIALLNDEKYQMQEAAREALRESRIVTLGEPKRALQETIIGITRDGRMVAVTQNSPQFLLVVGCQGSGKSHLLTLLMIGALIRWRGTGRLIEKNRIIRISSDWGHGANDDFLRAGFYLNPEDKQWKILEERFGILKGGEGPLRGGTLRVLPDAVERMKDRFRDLVVRGLDIGPLQLHHEELAQYGYQVLLTSGRDFPAHEKPKYQTLIESVIEQHGAATTPALLARELQRTKIDRGARERLLLQLKQIDKIATDQDHLVNTLLVEEGPNLLHLQSEFMSADQILPLQVAAVHAMARPLPKRAGDPYRIFIQDEHLASSLNPAVEEQSVLLGAFLRHRSSGNLMSAQAGKKIAKKLGPLLTILVLTKQTSRSDFEGMKKHMGILRNVSYKQVADLKDGQALIGSVRASDPEFTEGMVPITLRPCVTWTAGETFGAVA